MKTKAHDRAATPAKPKRITRAEYKRAQKEGRITKY
jgi:hypothetical protein